jgi:hypothetical protein
MSDNKDIKDIVSWKFYALLAGASVGLLGGLYTLYSLFSDNMDAELSDEQKEKLEDLVKISETINESSSETPTQKKESESSFAIRVFKQINELSEEMFLKENPDWISKRRTLLKDNKKVDYNSFCENILSEKMRIESQSAEMILNKLGMNQVELQTMMEKIPQAEFMQLQQQMMQKQQQSTSTKSPESFEDNDVIKAFKKFLLLKTDMDNESKNMQSFMNDQSEEAKMQFFLKLEINKYQIDDYLFNLYELDFSTLMMLINSRGLFSNPEISQDYQKLMAEFNQAQY